MPGRPLGTTLGAPLPPDLKKPQKSIPAITFLDLILGGILNTFSMFFECVFQVSFPKAFGPHFLDFGLSSATILKQFLLIFEDAGSLEK